ncbi:hypothetical protein QR685DRAFT_533158 [Neurospora intermedia]|uniref:Uncharacterized protein n=1 Tax=Neurospora intermedia TaxID=5142 RepID=A0ABR3D4X7_NEUIN
MALKEEQKPASALATENPDCGHCQSIEPNSKKKSSVRNEQETCVFVLGVACFMSLGYSLDGSEATWSNLSGSVCGCSPGLLPSLPVQVPHIRTNIRMLDDEPGPRELWIQKPINVSEDHLAGIS